MIEQFENARKYIGDMQRSFEAVAAQRDELREKLRKVTEQRDEHRETISKLQQANQSLTTALKAERGANPLRGSAVGRINDMIKAEQPQLAKWATMSDQERAKEIEQRLYRRVEWYGRDPHQTKRLRDLAPYVDPARFYCADEVVDALLRHADLS